MPIGVNRLGRGADPWHGYSEPPGAGGDSVASGARREGALLSTRGEQAVPHVERTVPSWTLSTCFDVSGAVTSVHAKGPATRDAKAGVISRRSLRKEGCA